MSLVQFEQQTLLLFSNHFLCALRYGSDALKREFLVPSIAGDFVSCIGVSEPHAGSDVSREFFSPGIKWYIYIYFFFLNLTKSHSDMIFLLIKMKLAITSKHNFLDRAFFVPAVDWFTYTEIPSKFLFRYQDSCQKSRGWFGHQWI